MVMLVAVALDIVVAEQERKMMVVKETVHEQAEEKKVVL